MPVTLKIEINGLCALVPDNRNEAAVTKLHVVLVDPLKIRDLPDPALHTPTLTFDSDALANLSEEAVGELLFVQHPAKPWPARLAILPLAGKIVKIPKIAGSFGVETGALTKFPHVEKIVDNGTIHADCLKSNPQTQPVGARVDLLAGCVKRPSGKRSIWSFYPPKSNSLCYKEEFSMKMRLWHEFTSSDSVTIEISDFGNGKGRPLTLASAEISITISNLPGDHMPPNHVQAFYRLCDPCPTKPFFPNKPNRFPEPRENSTCSDERPEDRRGAGIGCSPFLLYAS